MAFACTDVGTTPRTRLTDSEKLELYEAQQGLCPLCGRVMVQGEALTDEHMRALGLGGSNDPDNRAIVHRACALAKTHGPEGDLALTAKAKRRKRRGLGFVTPKRPMPGSKASGVSRGLDGLTRCRRTGRVLSHPSVIDVRSL
ncbi:HNH endonuclease [Methylobacterium radiodurans]|uniref:HNH endonuclease n=1 Tax=Methylobacterium radiodurans TaxID=2202828 RepID=A0A2U8VPZ7_9HYPH|nr:HNH endonuclease [Methylobacterium radiodurans]AWN35703.1 HNH endonuclease [Methylobacterium radiodurans]